MTSEWKNPQTIKDTLDFYRFSWSFAGPKSNVHSRTEISSIGVTNPEIVFILILLSQILCNDWFFFFLKVLTLTENLLNFNGTYMDREQPFENFWKMDALSS